MDDLGVPLFSETSKCWLKNPYIENHWEFTPLTFHIEYTSNVVKPKCFQRFWTPAIWVFLEIDEAIRLARLGRLAKLAPFLHESTTWKYIQALGWKQLVAGNGGFSPRVGAVFGWKIVWKSF